MVSPECEFDQGKPCSELNISKVDAPVD